VWSSSVVRARQASTGVAVVLVGTSTVRSSTCVTRAIEIRVDTRVGLVSYRQLVTDVNDRAEVTHPSWRNVGQQCLMCRSRRKYDGQFQCEYR
jgi:hypothetical protein